MMLSKIMPARGWFASGGKKILILPLALLLITGCTNYSSIQNELEKSVQENKANSQNTLTIPVTTQIEENQELNNNQDLTNMEKVKITTSLGDIVVALDEENAPITVRNFKDYVASGFYNGTLFHRVIPGFMIQGGGFDVDGNQKPTNAPIKNEAKNGLKNDRGTIAMARTMVVDSATSQFFINLEDNDFLDYRDDDNYGYAVFGKVVEGMDTVDKIAQVKTGNNGSFQDWPVENVVIESVELVK